jgi:hypothetical protein
MQIGNKEVAIVVVLHFNKLAQSSIIVAKVQVTG